MAPDIIESTLSKNTLLENILLEIHFWKIHFQKKNKRWLSQSVSDKVTYWAVRLSSGLSSDKKRVHKRLGCQLGEWSLYFKPHLKECLVNSFEQGVHCQYCSFADKEDNLYFGTLSLPLSDWTKIMNTKKSSKIYLSSSHSISFLCWLRLDSCMFICQPTNNILALFC